ncbi:MAG TPA: hypothetical protein VH120_14055 [Gemmataceae bacterium]|jgi:thioredoxin-related protein|nr:hypothetical protein [Gemmataceae bacterium]
MPRTARCGAPIFGFDGCSWCHKFHALFRENVDIRKVLYNEYVLVMVDTESPRASDLIKECKAALPKEVLERGVGYPFLAFFGTAGDQPTPRADGRIQQVTNR